MDYPKISKETMEACVLARKSLASSPLSAEIRALLDLAVSKVNNCLYCINVHTGEAKKASVSEEKIQSVLSLNFENNPIFTQKEILAFKYAIELTKLNGKPRIFETELNKHFSEREIVDIAFVVSMMNMFNRIAISMKSDS
jgi:AhpD family alkylhydroperoxidase